MHRVTAGVRYDCVACTRCGFHFVNPEPTPEELAAFYGGAYQERHGEVWHGFEDNMNRAVIGRLQRLGVRSLVDLGAGQGRFVRMAKDAGIDAHGVEPTPGNVRSARERYGVELVEATVAEHLGSGPRGVECITMLNVFEHLPDPVGVMHQVRAALRPGGIVLVIVPNLDFTLALGAVRGALGLADRYLLQSTRFSQQGFDPPVHLSSFTAPHLRQVFKLAGLAVESMGQAPVIGSANPIMRVAKWSVMGIGTVLGVLSLGTVQWGYSLQAIARAPAPR